jgi:hypothetical protein
MQDFYCAQDWIRTSTWFPTLRPEHSASTNFATWAELQRKQQFMNVRRLISKKFHHKMIILFNHTEKCLYGSPPPTSYRTQEKME